MFDAESFCGVCRTELIYDLWQILVFMVLNIVVPVGIMSVMYICSIRTIRREASKLYKIIWFIYINTRTRIYVRTSLYTLLVGIIRYKQCLFAW